PGRLATEKGARLGLTTEGLAPRLLPLEEAGQHGLVALGVAVLGVEAHLQPGARDELHLVVLAALDAVPDLEVAARAVGREAPQGGRQEAAQGVVDGVEEVPAHRTAD